MGIDRVGNEQGEKWLVGDRPMVGNKWARINEVGIDRHGKCQGGN